MSTELNLELIGGVAIPETHYNLISQIQLGETAAAQLKPPLKAELNHLCQHEVAWLRPHLPSSLRAPVIAYLVAISIMVVAASATLPGGGDPRIAAGAVLFCVSDLFVARERFVTPGFVNKALGLPLYYGGQLLLAASV